MKQDYRIKYAILLGSLSVGLCEIRNALKYEEFIGGAQGRRRMEDTLRLLETNISKELEKGLEEMDAKLVSTEEKSPIEKVVTATARAWAKKRDFSECKKSNTQEAIQIPNYSNKQGRTVED